MNHAVPVPNPQEAVLQSELHALQVPNVLPVPRYQSHAKQVIAAREELRYARVRTLQAGTLF